MEFLNYQNQAIRIMHYHKSGTEFDMDHKDQMIESVGDLLYAITTLCYEYDVSLETVALRNLAKLRKRQREK